MQHRGYPARAMDGGDGQALDGVVMSGETLAKKHRCRRESGRPRPECRQHLLLWIQGTRGELAGSENLDGAQPRGEQTRFAVVSCADYEWGYFSGYRAIFRRYDLDAVIPLGDYIYEYAENDPIALRKSARSGSCFRLARP